MVKPGDKLLMAAILQHSVFEATGVSDAAILATIRGSDLDGTICRHPLAAQGYDDFDVPLLPGDHVTDEDGTGLVHTAPGHGAEDFVVGQAFGLEVPRTVADNGVFYAHVPLFAGVHVFKADAPVADALAGAGNLLSRATLVHSYPHSWRSKAPLIYRTTPQWFISMDTNNLREKALAAIDRTSFYPPAGRNRLHGMVSNRPDWCVSRQRAWGSPRRWNRKATIAGFRARRPGFSVMITTPTITNRSPIFSMSGSIPDRPIVLFLKRVTI